MIQTLRLDQLRIDGGTQLRVKIDYDHVAEIKAAWAKLEDMPPFIAFFDGAMYWTADGFHRWHAANGKWLIVNVDVQPGSQRDALLYACGANTGHGLKRSNADKRKSVETLLNDPEWSTRSDNWIAGKAKVNNHLVGEIRSQLGVLQVGENLNYQTIPDYPNYQSCNSSANHSDSECGREGHSPDDKRDSADGKRRPSKNRDSRESAEKRSREAAEKATKSADRKAASDRKTKENADAKARKDAEREPKRKANENTNQAIPADLQPIFAWREKFRAYEKLHNPAIGELAIGFAHEAFEGGEGPLDHQKISNLLGQIYHLLMPWQPEKVCQCGGDIACKKCEGRGWIRKGVIR